ncbi:MAG TPA: hypothetical protein DCS93_23035 [Microscillaceae bacterium]|nr:hypothetical protein [Microscillaceae bacterium]
MENNFTVVVSHFVKQDKASAFEQALKQVIQKAKAYPGYEGIQIIQGKSKVEQEYVLLIRFDTEANYQTWAASAPRNEWFDELKEYVIRESKIRYQEGIEFWFSMPETPAVTAPKKWKMAILTWMVIYPLVLTLSTLVGLYLHFLPTFLRVLTVSLILVPLMTYLVMPQVTKTFAFWIFKK